MNGSLPWHLRDGGQRLLLTARKPLWMEGRKRIHDGMLFVHDLDNETRPFKIAIRRVVDVHQDLWVILHAERIIMELILELLLVERLRLFHRSFDGHHTHIGLKEVMVRKLLELLDVPVCKRLERREPHRFLR